MTSSYVLNYMPHGDLVYNRKLKSALCGGRGKSHEPAGVGRSRGNEHGGRKKEETCVHGCVVQSLRVAFSETLGRRLCLPFQSSTAPTKLGNMWRIKLSYKRIGRRRGTFRVYVVKTQSWNGRMIG